VLSSEHSGKQRAMNFMLDIAVSLSPEATKARLIAYRLANPSDGSWALLFGVSPLFFSLGLHVQRHPSPIETGDPF
jgi:hypothetical protein